MKVFLCFLKLLSTSSLFYKSDASPISTTWSNWRGDKAVVSFCKSVEFGGQRLSGVIKLLLVFVSLWNLGGQRLISVVTTLRNAL